MSSFSERAQWLKEQIANADYILIGAGSGLSAAAGLDYAGEDFRREFREWIDRYGIADLYSYVGEAHLVQPLSDRGIAAIQETTEDGGR